MGIIGFTGAIGSGKDTACIGKKIGFADALKEVCSDLTGHDYTLRETKDGFVLPGVTGRKMLETIGATMRSLDENFWLNLAMERVVYFSKFETVCIPDVRYKNEVDAIRKAGGVIVRINRDGCQRTGHESDNWDQLEFDYEIYNNGTLEEFIEKIKSWYSSLNLSQSGK